MFRSLDNFFITRLFEPLAGWVEQRNKNLPAIRLGVQVLYTACACMATSAALDWGHTARVVVDLLPVLPVGLCAWAVELDFRLHRPRAGVVPFWRTPMANLRIFLLFWTPLIIIIFGTSNLSWVNSILWSIALLLYPIGVYLIACRSGLTKAAQTPQEPGI